MSFVILILLIWVYVCWDSAADDRDEYKRVLFKYRMIHAKNGCEDCEACQEFKNKVEDL